MDIDDLKNEPSAIKLIDLFKHEETLSQALELSEEILNSKIEELTQNFTFVVFDFCNYICEYYMNYYDTYDFSLFDDEMNLLYDLNTICIKLHDQYIETMTDDQFYNLLKEKYVDDVDNRFDLYPKHVNIIVNNKYFKSLKFLLEYSESFNIDGVYEYIIDYLAINFDHKLIIDLINHIGLTNYNFNNSFTNTKLIDLLIELNYKFDQVYKFNFNYTYSNLDVFKYFMNHVDYEINTIDKYGRNIYFYNTENFELIRYIHQTYGHLVDITLCDNDGNTIIQYIMTYKKFIYNKEMLFYLFDNDLNYNNCNHQGQYWNPSFEMVTDILLEKLLTYNLNRQILIRLLNYYHTMSNTILNKILDRCEFLETSDLNIILSNHEYINFLDDELSTLVNYVTNLNLNDLSYVVVRNFYHFLLKYFTEDELKSYCDERSIYSKRK